MKLFYSKGACSLATHIALIWAGTRYETHCVGQDVSDHAALVALNPKGGVPTLVLDDGSVLTESLATLLHVADTHPAARLGAGPDFLERARLNEALSDLVSEVHPAFGPMYVPGRFVTQPAHEADARAAAFRRIDRQFTRMEALMADGRTFMVLGRRTVADAYLFVMTRWKNQTPTPLAAYPSLAAFNARLADNPGVRRAIAEEDAPSGATA